MENVVTTVRLPPELHEALRRRAFEERRPVAEIIREAVVAWLAAAETAAALPALERDPLWACVGSVGGGPSDEAERHDDYLYADRVAEGPRPSDPASKRTTRKRVTTKPPPRDGRRR